MRYRRSKTKEDAFAPEDRRSTQKNLAAAKSIVVVAIIEGSGAIRLSLASAMAKL